MKFKQLKIINKLQMISKWFNKVFKQLIKLLKLKIVKKIIINNILIITMMNYNIKISSRKTTEHSKLQFLMNMMK